MCGRGVIGSVPCSSVKRKNHTLENKTKKKKKKKAKASQLTKKTTTTKHQDLGTSCSEILWITYKVLIALNFHLLKRMSKHPA